MARPWLGSLLLGAAALAAEPELHLCVDAPADLGSITFQTSQAARKAAGGASYSLAFADASTLSTSVHIDALYTYKDGGCSPTSCFDFLFSTDAPVTISGTTYQPYEVIKAAWSGTTYTYSKYSGSPVITSADDAAVNIDALGMDNGGALLISFDAPYTDSVTGVTFQPMDVARVVGGTVQSTKVFQASSVNPALPSGTNVVGVEEADNGDLYLVFDAPVTWSGTTFQPAQLVKKDSTGQALALYWNDSTFPSGTLMSDFSFGVSPGAFSSNDLTVTKNAVVSGDLDFTFTQAASCMPNSAKKYVIYEGNIGTWYSHNTGVKSCAQYSSSSSTVSATVTPGGDNKYYIVVPVSTGVEGSYGTSSGGTERPAASAPCGSRTRQVIQRTACPSGT